jgi:hypothetical protein
MKYRRGATTELTSAICTSSTEAFALLVLENNWEYWKADVAAKRDKTENIEKTEVYKSDWKRWNNDGRVEQRRGHQQVHCNTRIGKEGQTEQKRKDLEKNILQYQKEQELEAAASKKGKRDQGWSRSSPLLMLRNRQGGCRWLRVMCCVEWGADLNLLSGTVASN